MIQETANRVRQMERYFDALKKAADENPEAFREDASIQTMLRSLARYYESGQWLQDYELDEKGLLPQNLKRGVLSQDAIYDFLDRMNIENSHAF